MPFTRFKFEDQNKEIARNSGAKLVGIATKDRLVGHECSDPTYHLPSAESVIGFAIPLGKKPLEIFYKKPNYQPKIEYHPRKGIYTIN